MKRRLTHALLALLSTLLLLASLSAPSGAQPAGERGPLRRAAAPERDDPTQARVIVKFKASSALMRPAAAGARAPASPGATGAAAMPAPQHAAALARRGAWRCR